MKNIEKTVTISGLDLTVRMLHENWEYEAAVDLQRATWGEERGELIYRTHMLITQKVGGIAAGAFHDTQLVGFVYGLTGIRDGELGHWSHMLAVHDDWRGRGLGRQLKIFQREILLQMNVKAMYWTFDPLVARNAHLNINRLGAVVQSYARDMYGYDPNGILSQGIGTDRFIIRWDLETVPGDWKMSDSVSSDVSIPIINTKVDSDGIPQPVEQELPMLARLRVEIPADILEIQNTDMKTTTAWRQNTQRIFIHYLDSGYRVAGFHRLPDTHRFFYTLIG
jgi:chorismate synthase